MILRNLLFWSCFISITSVDKQGATERKRRASKREQKWLDLREPQCLYSSLLWQSKMQTYQQIREE